MNTPLEWRKSSRSGTQSDCIEVALNAPTVAVRDSKNVPGPRLGFPPKAWSAFLRALPSPM